MIKVFAIHMHAMLSNGGPIYTSIIETSARWKIAKCNVINLLVRINPKRNCNNSTKFKIKKEVHTSNTCGKIPCIFPLIAVIFNGCLTVALTNLLAISNRGNFSVCVVWGWIHSTGSNILDEVNRHWRDIDILDCRWN